MQLGPVLSSHVAKHYGLAQSYLERLILRTVYRRDPDKYRDHGCYDPLLVGIMQTQNGWRTMTVTMTNLQ